MKKIAFAFVVCALVACGIDTAAPTEEPDPVDPPGDPFPPPPPPGVQITTGPLPIGPNEEKTFCVFIDMPNDAELPVVKLEQHNNGKAHHFILFKGTSAHEPGSGDCPAGLFVQHPPIYPGTRDQGAFAMPDGVAILLGKRQPLILQIHLLNSTDEPAVEELRMNLWGGSPGVEYKKAGVVGGSDFDFRIPPHEMYTSTQRCYLTNGMNLFALTSHSHSRTRSFDIKASLETGPAAIYHNESWSEPEVGHYKPAHAFDAFDWLEFSCTWFNETSEAITYGETADDEMCMMFGYYYPATLDVTPCLGL
jgi:hypothetical protein